MKTYGSIFRLNILVLGLVAVLIVYAKLFGSSVSALFSPPVAPRYPDERLLTYTFQILCSVPVMVCAFSWGLLKTIHPYGKRNQFILASALLTGGFLINEIFRVHVILGQMGVPKYIACIAYAILLSCYGFVFKRAIASTPYIPLVMGIGLLFFGIIIDALHLTSNGFSSLLEGIPKLLSEINIAFYFWYVCTKEVLRSLNFTQKRLTA